MNKLRATSPVIFALSLFLVACQPENSSEVNDVEAVSVEVDDSLAMEEPVAGSFEIEHDLIALPGLEEVVPLITEKTTIVLQTSIGNVVVEIYPEAAPNAAERFVELAETGFFDNTPVSRVVVGFVAQFGVNWREPHIAYQNNLFDDDPTLFALERGTLAFAKAGPNTNSTQVFINYGQNNRLASPQYNFTTFGKVVEGMNIVDSFAQVGDPNGGLDQGRLWNDGEAYLASLEAQPTMIERAYVQE